MRNVLLLIVSVLMACSDLGAQILSLSFKGKNSETGNVLFVDKVHIYNITNNTDTIVSGDVFNLLITGLAQAKTLNREISAYPNPFISRAFISVEGIPSEPTNLVLFNAEGKIIANWYGELTQGENRFEFESAFEGLNIAIVNTKDGTSAVRMICAGASNNSSIKLIEKNTEVGAVKLKSELIEKEGFRYSLGDRLMFVGYAKSYISFGIYDQPLYDTSYTFEFTAKYFVLKKHKIFSSAPSFVNLLFSVENASEKGVDFLTNDNFVVTEDNQKISPTETFMYVKKSNTVPFSLKTVLLLDNSASVKDDLESIKEAAKALIDSKMDRQQMAIYSFSDGPSLLQDFTTNFDSLKMAINSITLGFPTTDLYGSIKTAASRWNDQYSTSYIEQGYLIALTDGDDTQGSSTLSSAINAIGSKKTYMIGLGNEINVEALNQLANPGPYYSTQSIEELTGIFSEIQSDIVRQSNSFYWLTYMSPKRTGTHEIRLEITENENTARNNYIDGTFSATDFFSVTYGLYINPTPENIYGINKVELDNENPRQKLLSATYWAEYPPVYKWQQNDSNSIKFIEDTYDPNAIWIEAGSNKIFETTLTVTDIANDYEKSITVIFQNNLPELSVSSVESIDMSMNTATIKTEILIPEDVDIVQRGIVWGRTINPTLFNSDGYSSYTTLDMKLIDTLSELIIDTAYYIRAYAKGKTGIVYSDAFKLLTNAGVPTLEKPRFIEGSDTSAVFRSSIYWNGNAPVLEYGICWDTLPNTDITDLHTVNNKNSYFILDTLAGLTANKKYYIRAYAKNAFGIGYGTEDTLWTFIKFYTEVGNHSFARCLEKENGDIIFIGDTLVEVDKYGKMINGKAIQGHNIISSYDSNYLILQDDNVLKLDQQFDTIWHSEGINAYGNVGSFLEHPDSSIYVIKFNGSGKQSLFHLDQMGSVISSHTLNIGYNDLDSDIQLISDTTFVVVGYGSGSLVGWGGGYVAAAAKFDIHGNEIWEKGVFDFTNSFNHGYSIKETDDRGFIITGSAYSYSRNDTRCLVVKTDSEFNKIWSKSFNTDMLADPDLTGNYIQITKNGNYVIAAHQTVVTGSANEPEIASLIMMSPQGEILWDTKNRGPDGRYSFVIESIDGGFIVCVSNPDEISYLIKLDKFGYTVY